MSDTSFHEFCGLQVRRLAGTEFFPRGEDGKAALIELVRTLESRIDSRGRRQFVTAVIDECLKVSKHCPTVHDLITVSGEIRAEERRAEAEEEAAHKRAQWERECGPPVEFNWNIIDLAKAKAAQDRHRDVHLAVQKRIGRRSAGWEERSRIAGELGYYDYAKAWFESIVGNRHRWKDPRKAAGAAK